MLPSPNLKNTKIFKTENSDKSIKLRSLARMILGSKNNEEPPQKKQRKSRVECSQTTPFREKLAFSIYKRQTSSHVEISDLKEINIKSKW